MKRAFLVFVALVIALGAVGCKKQERTQQQLNYSGAPVQPALPSLTQIEPLRKAAEASPKSAAAWINLGNALMDLQRFGEAVDAYEKALVLEPKNVPVLVDQGTCYRGIGKFDKAVEQYRKAIRFAPDFPNAHRNLGVVLAYDLHDAKEGIKEFQKYLELMPNAPDAEQMRQTIQELSAGK